MNFPLKRRSMFVWLVIFDAMDGQDAGYRVLGVYADEKEANNIAKYRQVEYEPWLKGRPLTVEMHELQGFPVFAPKDEDKEDLGYGAFRLVSDRTLARSYCYRCQKNQLWNVETDHRIRCQVCSAIKITRVDPPKDPDVAGEL